METISVDYHDKVALVKLNRGVTNALNLQLANELSEVLQRAGQDAAVRGLVLCSANDKFFSIGFDIPSLFPLSREEFVAFYRAFNRAGLDLYGLPKPTVAAISGHAIAGGCILALCCDYRFIAEGRKLMGLNEVQLGVPVPYLADCILRDLVGTRLARDIMEVGDFYQSDELARMGVVDRVLPLEQVLQAAIEKASAIGAFPQAGFAAIKRNRVEPIETRVLARLGDKKRDFAEHWYSDEARAKLREAIEKF